MSGTGWNMTSDQDVCASLGKYVQAMAMMHVFVSVCVLEIMAQSTEKSCASPFRG